MKIEVNESQYPLDYEAAMQRGARERLNDALLLRNISIGIEGALLVASWWFAGNNNEFAQIALPTTMSLSVINLFLVNYFQRDVKLAGSNSLLNATDDSNL